MVDPQPSERTLSQGVRQAPKRRDDRSADLLQRAIAHLQIVGLEGFSLAALAEALNTSSRMLIYHLGSRDEILGQIQAAMRSDVTSKLRAREFDRLHEAVQATWDFYVARLSHMELFFHLVSRSFEEPTLFPEFTATAVTAWTDFFEEVAVREGYPQADAEALARLALATFRGLTLDLAISGDLKRTGRAMKQFTELLIANSPLRG